MKTLLKIIGAVLLAWLGARWLVGRLNGTGTSSPTVSASGGDVLPVTHKVVITDEASAYTRPPIGIVANVGPVTLTNDNYRYQGIPGRSPIRVPARMMEL